MASLNQRFVFLAPQTLNSQAANSQPTSVSLPRKRKRHEVQVPIPETYNQNVEATEQNQNVEATEQNATPLAVPHIVFEPTPYAHPSFQPVIYRDPFEASLAAHRLRNLETTATYLASIRGLRTSRGRSPQRTHSPTFPYKPYGIRPSHFSTSSSNKAKDRTGEVYAIPARQDLLNEDPSAAECGRCLAPLRWGSELPSSCQQPYCRAVNIGDDWAANERFRQSLPQRRLPRQQQTDYKGIKNYLGRHIDYSELFQWHEDGARKDEDPVDWDSFIHWDVLEPDRNESEFEGSFDNHSDEDLRSETSIMTPLDRGQDDRAQQNLTNLPAAQLGVQPLDIPEWLHGQARAKLRVAVANAFKFRARFEAHPYPHAESSQRNPANTTTQQQQDNNGNNTSKDVRDDTNQNTNTAGPTTNPNKRPTDDRLLPNPNALAQQAVPTGNAPAVTHAPNAVLTIDPFTGRAEVVVSTSTPTAPASPHPPPSTTAARTTATTTNSGAPGAVGEGRWKGQARLRKMSSLLADMGRYQQQEQESQQQPAVESGADGRGSGAGTGTGDAAGANAGADAANAAGVNTGAEAAEAVEAADAADATGANTGADSADATTRASGVDDATGINDVATNAGPDTAAAETGAVAVPTGTPFYHGEGFGTTRDECDSLFNHDSGGDGDERASVDQHHSRSSSRTLSNRSW